MHQQSKLIPVFIIGLISSLTVQAAHRCDGILEAAVVDKFTSLHRQNERALLQFVFCHHLFDRDNAINYHFDHSSNGNRGSGGINVYDLFDLEGSGSSTTIRELTHDSSGFKEKRDAICSYYKQGLSSARQYDIFEDVVSWQVKDAWRSCIVGHDEVYPDAPLICAVTRQGTFVTITLNIKNNVIGRITNVDMETDNLKKLSSKRIYLKPGNTHLIYKVENALENAKFHLHGEALLNHSDTPVQVGCQKTIFSSEADQADAELSYSDAEYFKSDTVVLHDKNLTLDQEWHGRVFKLHNSILNLGEHAAVYADYVEIKNSTIKSPYAIHLHAHGEFHMENTEIHSPQKINLSGQFLLESASSSVVNLNADGYTLSIGR